MGGVIGGQRIHVYAGLPRGEEVDSDSDPGAPAADYGDAPDGQLAYPGTLGKFPTLFSTMNGISGAPGAHALLLGFEMLGDTVSQEEGALDPTDSDGETNLVDADKDDRIFWSWDRNTTPPTSHIIYDVTISAGATLFTPRWVNVLVDLDQSGDWKNTATTTEWVTVNQVFIPPAIGTYTLMTPPFFWKGTGNLNGPTLAWTRILLHADEELDPGDFGAAGWDGSGSLSSRPRWSPR